MHMGFCGKLAQMVLGGCAWQEFEEGCFSQKKESHVGSGITLKHWAEILAFGFLHWSRLHRSILDACLMQILFFPKNERRYAYGTTCILLPC